MKYCLLDLDKNEHMVDLFIPSIYDAGEVFSQKAALKYISTLTKGKTIEHVYEVLMNYFLPHISISNLELKAYFLGYLVYRLLKVYNKEKKHRRIISNTNVDYLDPYHDYLLNILKCAQ